MSKEVPNFAPTREHKSWEQLREVGSFTSLPPVSLGTLTAIEIAMFVDAIALYPSYSDSLTPPYELRPILARMLEQTFATFPIRNTHEWYTEWFNASETKPEDCMPHLDAPPGFLGQNFPTDFLRTTVAVSLDGNSSGPIHYPGVYELNAETFPDPKSFGNFDITKRVPFLMPELTIATHSGMDVHARPVFKDQRGIFAVSFYPKMNPIRMGF